MDGEDTWILMQGFQIHTTPLCGLCKILNLMPCSLVKIFSALKILVSFSRQLYEAYVFALLQIMTDGYILTYVMDTYL